MSYGDSYKSEKDIGNSNAENREHEASMFGKRVMPLPTNQQILAENDGDGNPVYVGYAPKALAEGTDGWAIYNISWVSGNFISKLTGYGNWTNRALEIYE